VGFLTESRVFGIFDIYDFLLTIDYWLIMNDLAGPAGSKTLPRCGLRHATLKSFAYWRLVLACWLTYAYYNILSNNSQKNNGEKCTFFVSPEFFDLSRVYVCFARRKTLFVGL
jgi:hypothetical protein